MLSGYDVNVVGICEVDEDLCLACSAKKYGSLRLERLRIGLESHDWHEGPKAFLQWQADDDARNRGYECDCLPGDDVLCPSCTGTFCCECGKRLDGLEVVPAASSEERP